MKATITTEDGREWEVDGGYYHARELNPKSYVIDGTGKVIHAGDALRNLVYLHVKPIPKRHTIGGVVWEEVEEKPRPPRKGEWFLSTSGRNVERVGVMRLYFDYTIVRPVAIEEDES